MKVFEDPIVKYIERKGKKERKKEEKGKKEVKKKQETQGTQHSSLTIWPFQNTLFSALLRYN